jgi:hypothetical protein
MKQKMQGLIAEVRRCAAALNMHGVRATDADQMMRLARIEDARRRGLSLKQMAQLMGAKLRTVQYWASKWKNKLTAFEDGTPPLARLLRVIREPAAVDAIAHELSWERAKVQMWLDIGVQQGCVEQLPQCPECYVATGKGFIPDATAPHYKRERSLRAMRVWRHARKGWTHVFDADPAAVASLSKFLEPAHNPATPCMLWVERAWKMRTGGGEGAHNFGLLTALAPCDAEPHNSPLIHGSHVIAEHGCDFPHVCPFLVTLDERALKVFHATEFERIQEAILDAIAEVQQKPGSGETCRYQISVLWAYSDSALNLE